MTPLGVFVVTWSMNVAGAMSVWAVARHYGRRFAEGEMGRRLLPARALRVVEEEYRRYGVAGLFLAKLLPGVRAVAAPFAGMADVSAGRALLPMAVASGIWYGGITLLGASVGRNWAAVEALLGRVNRTLGIAGGVLVALVVVAAIVRRRRRRDRPDGGAP